MTAILRFGVYINIINSYKFQNCSENSCFQIYLFKQRWTKKMCISFKYIQIFIFVNLDQRLISQDICALRFFWVSLLVWLALAMLIWCICYFVLRYQEAIFFFFFFFFFILFSYSKKQFFFFFFSIPMYYRETSLYKRPSTEMKAE